MTGIFIPIEILTDTNLNIQEKLILSLIKITNNCYQTNQSIGQLVGLSKGRVSAIISSLVAKGYVELELHYKANSKQVDTRILRLKRTVEKIQETIKKVVSNAKNKSKEIKSDYVSVETTVGTATVQQQSFSNKFYKKTDKKARFNNIAQHNWDMNELERLEQERNYTLSD